MIRYAMGDQWILQVDISIAEKPLITKVIYSLVPGTLEKKVIGQRFNFAKSLLFDERSMIATLFTRDLK